jgi:hypothetical protein
MTINYVAIFCAALASFIFGSIWYGLLSRQWMAAIGFDPKDMLDANGKPKIPVFPMAVSFAAELIMALVLSGVLAHVAKSGVTMRAGLMTGFICWFGFVITTLATNHAYGKAKPSLTVIDGGHWLGVLLLQGLVLGLFG